MAGHGHTLDFIGATFPSAWALEVLRLLVETRPAQLTEEQMIAALRASKGAISQSVATLRRAGLVAGDGHGVRFEPLSPDLEGLAIAAIELYRRRPDLVRRTIVSHTSPGIAAFADAFKLRKDK